MILWLSFLILALAAPVQKPACDPIEGVETVLRPGAIVLLGELHGTAESPATVARLACLALAEGHAVTVALELPASEHDTIERFLASPGPAGGARPTPPLGAFWRREYQDGRTSEAMLALLGTLRAWRLDGHDLDVVSIDRPSAMRDRDRIMAETVATLKKKAPSNLFLTLTGNLHNRRVRGVGWDPDYEPMGLRLERLLPDAPLISLDLTHAGGTAWICTGGKASDCGPRKVGGVKGSIGRIEMIERAPSRPFDGTLHVGSITASPPAVTSASPVE